MSNQHSYGLSHFRVAAVLLMAAAIITSRLYRTQREQRIEMIQWSKRGGNTISSAATASATITNTTIATETTLVVVVKRERIWTSWQRTCH